MGKDSDTSRWRLPAEWEPQRGVMLTWPHAGTDWAPMLDEVLTTYRQMAHAIVEGGDELLIVSPQPLDDPALRGLPYTNVVCPTDDTWARDHGFLTLVSADGRRRLLDYQFNGWGQKFAATQDNAINRHVYQHHLRTQGHQAGQATEYVDRLDFVLEGGSIESDGQGTVMTTSGCLLAPHRNEPMTRQQIEQRLLHDLGASRMVWIDHGQLAGDDTDGHIDTLVRLCPDDTLLYIGCDDPADEHYHELRLMEEQLQALRTLDGRPYRLLKLPMPHPIHDEDGQRLPATYANFLVLNQSVLLPTYGQPDNDRTALQLVEQAFPGRRVACIDSRPLIRQHGSIHCCTMQFPL